MNDFIDHQLIGDCLSKTKEESSSKGAHRVPTAKDHDGQSGKAFPGGKSTLEDSNSFEGEVGTGKTADCTCDRDVEVAKLRRRQQYQRWRDAHLLSESEDPTAFYRVQTRVR